METSIAEGKPTAVRGSQWFSAILYLASRAKLRDNLEALKSDRDTPVVTSALRVATSAAASALAANRYIRSYNRVGEHLPTSISPTIKVIKEEFGDVTASAACTAQDGGNWLPQVFSRLIEPVETIAPAETLQTPDTTI